MGEQQNRKWNSILPEYQSHEAAIRFFFAPPTLQLNHSDLLARAHEMHVATGRFGTSSKRSELEWEWVKSIAENLSVALHEWHFMLVYDRPRLSALQVGILWGNAGVDQKALVRLRDCCRQSQAEVVSTSGIKIVKPGLSLLDEPCRFSEHK